MVAHNVDGSRAAAGRILLHEYTGREATVRFGAYPGTTGAGIEGSVVVREFQTSDGGAGVTQYAVEWYSAPGTPEVQAIAEAHGKTVPQVVFRFALQLGMLPLTGTTNSEHMAQDLDVFDFELSDAELETLGS